MTWKLDKVTLSSETYTLYYISNLGRNATIERLAFTKPTPVQAVTIPLFLSHKDVVVEAVTGSGKTLAFLIPIVEILSRRKTALGRHQVGAIIISPTRELALQIKDVLFELFRERAGITQVTLIGGTDVSNDIQKITGDGCNIVIATPGRLLDILERRLDVIDLKSLEMLILDEADRLLNLGFERTINSILEKLPKQRRTGLFSATMSDALSELIRTGLRNPVRITVKVENATTRMEQKTPETLNSSYTICEYENRLPFLLSKLRTHPAKKSIVYFGTCASVEYFNRILPMLPKDYVEGIAPIFALHGRMDSKKRLRIYGEFVKAERAVLICTDLAARGLDFSNVELVLQYDAPQDPTTFVHRCGRTARSGRSGEAQVLLSELEDAYVEFLSNRKVPLVEAKEDSGSTNESFFELLRRLNSKDRDLLDRSTKAFVAFIRFYQEHQAKFIFRLKDLDISGVAKSFGLLRLPRMPELKGISSIDFKESPVNISEIKYKDPHRNKQRQQSFEALKKMKESGKKPSKREFELGPKTRSTDVTQKSSSNKLNLDELDDDWKEYKKLVKKNKSNK